MKRSLIILFGWVIVALLSAGLPIGNLAAQGLTNEGAIIKVIPDTHLKMKDGGLSNAGGGELSNDGSVQLDQDFEQTGTGTSYGGSGWLSFEGSTDQTISGVANVIENLKVDNGNRLIFLNNDVEVGVQVDLSQNGSILLNGNDLILSTIAAVNNYSPTAYIITNSTGGLKQPIGSLQKLFPVGNSVYNPAFLVNTGVQDLFTIRVEDAKLVNGDTGPVQTTNAVGRTWDIQEMVPGGSILHVTQVWNTSDELPGFDRAECGVTRWDGSVWQADPTLTFAGSVGANVWFQNRSGLTETGLFSVEGCVAPELPTLVLTNDTICPSDSSTISVVGSNLNGASSWGLYENTPNGALVASSATGIFIVSPSTTTDYYVRGIGGCGFLSAPTAMVTVTVGDFEAPVVYCPNNVTVAANTYGCLANIRIPIPQITENCGLDFVINDFNGYLNASGKYPNGVTEVVYKAHDDAGNVGTCSFTVTVNSPFSVDAGPDQSVLYASGVGRSLDPCDVLAANVVGGSGRFDYWWSPSVGLNRDDIPQPTACPRTDQTYVLLVIDDLLCIDRDTVFVQSVNISGSLPCAPPGCDSVFVCVNGNTTTAIINRPCNDPTSLCYALNNGGIIGACSSKQIEVSSAGFTFDAYPNPFSGQSTLAFTSPVDDHMTLHIYGVSGVEVARVFEGEVKANQAYSATFTPNKETSGVFFARLVSSSGKQYVKKLLLIR